VWRADSGERWRILENHTEAVNDMALRPQEKGALPMLVSVGEDRTVRFWQPTIGRLVRFSRLPARPQAVAWSRDGTRVFVVSNNGSLHIVDPDTTELIEKIQAIKGWAYSMTVHPEEPVVLVGGEKGILRKVNVKTGR
jgi:WD40 repeat protein